MWQVCFKKISLIVSRMYQEFLIEVSFAIMLHESHRSYPSRRRACFFTWNTFLNPNPIQVLLSCEVLQGLGSKSSSWLEPLVTNCTLCSAQPVNYLIHTHRICQPFGKTSKDSIDWQPFSVRYFFGRLL